MTELWLSNVSVMPQVPVDRIICHEVRGPHRDVPRASAARTVELADTVDRVVVVEREQELIARLERIRFSDQLERHAGVRGEDDAVDVR